MLHTPNARTQHATSNTLFGWGHVMCTLAPCSYDRAFGERVPPQNWGREKRGENVRLASCQVVCTTNRMYCSSACLPAIHPSTAFPHGLSGDYFRVYSFKLSARGICSVTGHRPPATGHWPLSVSCTGTGTAKVKYATPRHPSC